MPADTLNMVTARLRHQQSALDDTFYRALATASVFRKIRLAYALKFRTTDAHGILYRIRNGKSYATAFDFSNYADAQAAFEVVMQSLTKDIAQNVAGKRIFIPANIHYSLPATEKQFTGNLPSGSYVELTQDMIVGIHWENVAGERIDLDLSLITHTGAKLGWDGGYRSSDRTILFSGDMVDAPPPLGASELYYVSQKARGTFVIFVNHFTFHKEKEVPFKLLVAHEQPTLFTRNYTINPNTIVVQSNTMTNVKQKMLGILVADDTSCKLYFAESTLGSGRSASNREYIQQARNYLLKFYTDSILLNTVLVDAGATLVRSENEADINLSPEHIDKSSFISLITGNSN